MAGRGDQSLTRPLTLEKSTVRADIKEKGAQDFSFLL